MWEDAVETGVVFPGQAKEHLAHKRLEEAQEEAPAQPSRGAPSYQHLDFGLLVPKCERINFYCLRPHGL